MEKSNAGGNIQEFSARSIQQLQLPSCGLQKDQAYYNRNKRKNWFKRYANIKFNLRDYCFI